MLERGMEVLILKAKKKRHVGKVGVVQNLDRGNVWVEVDGEVICTRSSSLGEPPPLTQIARATPE